jgi:hypothetical protein
MSVRLSVIVVGLVLVAVAGLAGAAVLAQEPSPTPTPEPNPIPTQPPPPDPLPAGCAPGAPYSPSAPKGAGDLWLEEVLNPNLPLTVVVLRWHDLSPDDLCFAVERRVGNGSWEWLSALPTNEQGTYDDGLPSEERLCYRVLAGNDAGRSEYSNEACLEPSERVAAMPGPTPTGCNFPAPTPPPGATPSPPSTATAAPAAPSDLRAELVPDPDLVSGFAVQLTWQDNADNDECHLIEVWAYGQQISSSGSVYADGSQTGLNSWRDIPGSVGLRCYRVYYGNNAGGAYSSKTCVNVEVLPELKATPTSVVSTATPPATSPAATANPASAALAVPRALPATGREAAAMPRALPTSGAGSMMPRVLPTTGTDLPTTGAGREEIAFAWQALAAAGSALLGAAAVSLVAARRRP